MEGIGMNSVNYGLPGTVDLSGRRVLVTGAARGIGSASVQALAELGAEVVGTDVLPMDETAAKVAGRGGTFEGVQGDLAEDGLVGELLAAGPFFALAHVAAVFMPPPDLPERERFRLVMDINVRASMRLASTLVDHMAPRGEGYVVIAGSLAGRSGGTVASDSLDYATYAASKGGVHSVVRWLSRRAIISGVRVNGVAPGGVDTPMTHGLTFDPAAFPLGRMGRPEEVAWPIALLCTPAASLVSGVILDVNGGVWMG
jgi:3-oxoacyl-[acyl-carrier protein] reductase